MLDKYEQSPSIRRLIHMILFLVFLFALASLLQGIGAIRWWQPKQKPLDKAPSADYDMPQGLKTLINSGKIAPDSQAVFLCPK